MNQRLKVLSEWGLMVLASAFLYVVFFRLNDLLFSSLKYTEGVNWIFLPAGFRVLLVLILGLPGALGIVAGNLWLDEPALDAFTWLPIVLTSLASGLGPWAIKCWMESRHRLNKQLQDITPTHLLNFVLAYAVFNALSHQFIRWEFLADDSQPWIDIWPMMVGDVLGATLVLYATKYALQWLRWRAGKPD